MGKFFNGRVKQSRASMVKMGLIIAGVVLIILIFIIIAIRNNSKNPATLVLVENLTLEINSEEPNKMDFFSQFENFDEEKITIDYRDFDITEVGTYVVTVKAEGLGQEDVTVNVVDTTAPELTLNEVEIPYGQTYKAEDFITSCIDNSNEECYVEYYSEQLDQNGNKISFSSYTEVGTYVIKLVAKDNSDNYTNPKETTLTIVDNGEGGGGSSNEPDPSLCLFGGLSIDKTQYDVPLAIVVGDKTSGCALDRDLWDDKEVTDSVAKFYNIDYQKLKNDLKEILKTEYPQGANIVAYPNYIAILNESITGLVGYAIEVKVYVTNVGYTGAIDTEENLQLSYYLLEDQSREYLVNKFNLK